MNWSEYILENQKAMRQVDELDLRRFVTLLTDLRKRKGKLWVLGNGGSASLASHAVADFGKTVKQGGALPIFTIAPSEFVSMQTAYANDLSFEAGFSSLVTDFATAGDAIWIVSVSGTSPNLLAAASAAKAKGIGVFSTVGAKGRALAQESDIGIVIDSMDYQVVENMHLLLMHWFTKELSRQP